eukprot:TRINITY_DN4943_c0_g1_i2.p1 TRINITY_DN4943_c0_g1~~TRINITY_DN4943_c0_g1_i2.p1  ORF type:complete len:382 (-),score=89.92 TRINITY_DN4943_c0_g1_i2:47-1192(-)
MLKVLENGSTSSESSSELQSVPGLSVLLEEYGGTKSDDLNSSEESESLTSSSSYEESSSESETLAELLNMGKNLTLKPKKLASPKFTFSFTDDSEVVNPIENSCGLFNVASVHAEMNKAGLKKRSRNSFLSMDTSKNKYEMQDAHLCVSPLIDDFALFCVFDGHAGASCATKLKEIFGDHMETELRKKFNYMPKGLKNIWGRLYKKVDAKLVEYDTEGSTATTCVIWRSPSGKRYLQTANVGDSHAYLFRSGVGIPLTVEHKADNPLERERITNMGIKLEENQTRIVGLNVSRSFGNHFPKEIESGMVVDPSVSDVFEITDQDTHLILASDGLWDVFTEDQVYNIVTKDTGNINSIAKRLLRKATASSACQDNITIIVVSL